MKNGLENNMRKIQLGAGGHNLPGWENYDMDCDITKPLPFSENSIDFIMLEHVIEHVTQHQGYRFFEECMRVLKPGGVVRVVFPDIKRAFDRCDERYREFVKRYLGGTVTNKIAIEQLIFNFGHVSIYTVELMMAILTMIGFQARYSEYNKSTIPELNNIESHWKAIGWEAAFLESSVVEGTKLDI